MVLLLVRNEAHGQQPSVSTYQYVVSSALRLATSSLLTYYHL